MSPPTPLFQVVHEDSDLLVLHKPAGLVCHPTKGDEYSSLASRVRLHLGSDARAHLINRLDRETSGLVVVSKTDQCARELRRIWAERAVEKVYEAIAWGHPQQDQEVIDAPLGKDEASVVAIKDIVRPDGAAAQTCYRVLQRFEREGEFFSHLEVKPVTGRKHQIRIHLAHVNLPILGDKLYGRDPDCYLAFIQDRLTPAQRHYLKLQNHALHAARIAFSWRGRQWEFSSAPEAEFRAFLPGTPVSR